MLRIPILILESGVSVEAGERDLDLNTIMNGITFGSLQFVPDLLPLRPAFT